MPPNRSSAWCTAAATCWGLVTSSAAGSTRCGAASARSLTVAASRAVTTALWPASITASASARPSPVEQPVMSQVDMGGLLSVAALRSSGMVCRSVGQRAPDNQRIRLADHLMVLVVVIGLCEYIAHGVDAGALLVVAAD